MGARPPEPTRPLRPRELEDALNLYVYHPLAWRLARVLARTRLTPNQVSIAGGLTVVAAGIAYSGPEWGGPAWPLSAALGMALHIAWHVIDGADGDLARMTGRTSPIGEMVDGLCDYASHVVLYLLLAWVLAQSLGPAAWGIAVAAGIAHALQSNHVETQRRFYLYWIYGKPWLNNRRPETRGPFGWLVSLYLGQALRTSPRALAVDRAVTAAKADPARLERIRAAIRAESAPLLRIEKLLGANRRAIALGLSMLLTASPLAYFVYGGVWMSALLVVSMVMHDRAWTRVAARRDA
jgi:hypothetical protein